MSLIRVRVTYEQQSTFVDPDHLVPQGGRSCVHNEEKWLEPGRSFCLGIKAVQRCCSGNRC